MSNHRDIRSTNDSSTRFTKNKETFYAPTFLLWGDDSWQSITAPFIRSNEPLNLSFIHYKYSILRKPWSWALNLELFFLLFVWQFFSWCHFSVLDEWIPESFMKTNIYFTEHVSVCYTVALKSCFDDFAKIRRRLQRRSWPWRCHSPWHCQ